MTPAVKRFEQLRKAYTDAIPSKDRTPKRRREAAWAASLTVAIENTAQEIARGARSEAPELKQMRLQVDRCLAAAHSLSTFETRTSR